MTDKFVVNQHGVVVGIPAAHLAMVIAKGGREATEQEAIEAGLLKPAPKTKRAPKAKTKDSG